VSLLPALYRPIAPAPAARPPAPAPDTVQTFAERVIAAYRRAKGLDPEPEVEPTDPTARAIVRSYRKAKRRG
jgi:hypothetical protein